MSDKQGYNGWKNYETWVMNLWMDNNDEGSYHAARAFARVAVEDHDHEYPRVALADRLKDWQEESMPDLDASVWSDLLSAAFSEVDWIEIADCLLTEVRDEEVEE